MYPPIDAYRYARDHQADLRHEAETDRLIRESRKARYARTQNGYRFIPAGAPIFVESTEQPCTAA